MVLRRRNITTVLFLVAGCLAFSAPASAAPPEAQAKASACDSFGDTAPAQLSLSQARKAVLCLVNAERTSRGLSPLKRNKRLDKAAQRHNVEMLGTGCFAHECPGEPTLGDRLEQISYLVGGLVQWAFGENVAWGLGAEGTPRSVVAAWMKSSGHRANILNGKFREIGIGFNAGTPEANSAPGGVYTTDFGLRVG